MTIDNIQTSIGGTTLGTLPWFWVFIFLMYLDTPPYSLSAALRYGNMAVTLVFLMSPAMIPRRNASASVSATLTQHNKNTATVK